MEVNAGSVVAVRCLRCQHEGVLSRNDLTRFGLNPHSPIAAYVKRLRCGECASSHVMAKRKEAANR